MRKKISKYIMAMCLYVPLNLYGQMAPIAEADEIDESRYLAPEKIIQQSVEAVQKMSPEEFISARMRGQIANLDRSLDRSGNILRAKLFICGAIAMCVMYKIRLYLVNKRAKRKEDAKKEAHGQANR